MVWYEIKTAPGLAVIRNLFLSIFYRLFDVSKDTNGELVDFQNKEL